VRGPGKFAVPGHGVTVEVRAAPGDGVPWPLELRTRRPGDRFSPERGRGTKKLKSWLIDRKVPREERDGLLVLADAAGRVFALPSLGVRAAGPGPGFQVLILQPG
jgi:tRNA(Ile)-lysidine synthase